MTGPGIDPTTDLDAYLRQYKDKFTRDAMAAKLIEAGHDADAVEAAIARIEAEREAVVTDALAAADAEEARVRSSRRVAATIVLLVYVGAALWLVASVSAGTTFFNAGNAALLVLVAIIGVALAWLLYRTRSVIIMITWAAVAIVLGLPVAFFGACLFGLGSGTYL